MIFNLGMVKPKKLPVLNSIYPADVSTDVGLGALFRVEITQDGFPNEYTYQWYVNGAKVAGATETSFSISAAPKGITAVYCNVTSRAGTIQSRTAILTANRLWLFNNGDQHAKVTGGWSYTGTDSYAGVHGGLLRARGSTPVSTNRKVSLAGYRYLYAYITKTENPFWENYGGNCIFGVSGSTTGDTNYTAFAGSGNGATGLARVDVSALNGEYFVKMSAYLSYFDISQFYLE